MESSFKNLPNQLEWAFPALLGYCIYLFFLAQGAVSVLAILTASIILNGWISSHASSELYSDMLLVTDVFAMGIYYCMALTLHSSINILLPSYWIYSACLCIVYLCWDLIFLTLLKDEYLRRKFKVYCFLMAISATIFLLVYYFQKETLLKDLSVVSLGSLIWISVLIKWHWDKWQYDKIRSSR